MNLSHIFRNYQLPAYSVFIRVCLYSHHVNGVTRIIKAESWFSLEPTRRLHGVYTDHPGWSHLPGPIRTTTDVLNFSKRPCWRPGTSRISPDVPGQTRTKQGPPRTYTVATRFTRRIIPDVIRVDPAPIWDWDKTICFDNGR